MTKAVTDVAIEIGAFRCGGDQILKDNRWNVEVAVRRASAELQLERFIGGVSRRLEHGRIQSSIETLGVSHGAISLSFTLAPRDTGHLSWAGRSGVG